MRYLICFITLSITLLFYNENTFSQCNVPIPAKAKTGSANLYGNGSNIRWLCPGDSVYNIGGGSNTYFMESGSYAYQNGGGSHLIYVKHNAKLDIGGGGGSITVYYELGAIINNTLNGGGSNYFNPCSVLKFDYSNAPSYGCCHDDSVFNSMSISVCDSAFLGGAYRKHSGTYYDTIHINFGCDSIIVTKLFVHNPYPYTDTNYIIIYKTVTDTLLINVSLPFPNPNNENLIKVYPNPAKNHILIENSNYSSMSGYLIKITNSTNQIVFETIINQRLIYVDLSRWTGNGLYFLHLIDTQHKTVDIKKIMLQ